MMCGVGTDSGCVQFVFVSLAGWGALFYGGYKFFTSGSKKPGKEEPCPEGMMRAPGKKRLE